MRKILFAFALLFLPLGMLFAQSNKSSIRFRLSDGDLMKIAINERYYHKTGRSLTVGDIPGKKPAIKVYRYRPYGNKAGGKASLLFSGTLKIEKGEKYEAVVDVKTGKLSLTNVSHLGQNIPTKMPPGHDLPVAPTEPEGDKIVPHEPPVTNPGEIGEAFPISDGIVALQEKMDKEVSDSKKLEVANQFLKGTKSITSVEMRYILSALLFDDSRLKFIKSVYEKVSDLENIGIIHSTLSEEDSQAELEQFLNEKAK